MFRRILVAAALVGLAFVPAAARVDVTLDQSTLNDLISAMAPDRVPVTLGGGARVNLLMKEIRVTGFDPAAASGGGRGHVLTSLRLQIPEIGLDVPVTPRLSLQFKEASGRKIAYLRFEQVNVPLPVTGNLNVAPLLPLLPIVTDTAFAVESARGDLRVTPRLVEAVVGARNIRLGFDLDVAPAPKEEAAGGTR